TSSTDNPYTQYPSVAKTASINGFADKIYDDLPPCAQPCMFQNTGITPCPYWDTGCLCVMPQFGGLIGDCIADACRGEEVSVATSLAISICSSAGVWEPYWMIPASVSEALASAAADVATA
ncbi:repressed by TUP1 protein 5, partial [Scheffersomyces stipitis CBS 6054]